MAHWAATGARRPAWCVGSYDPWVNLLVSRIGALFERYPGLSVELVVREGSRDLIEERLDVAVQLGPPSDTSAVARVLGTFGRTPVAAPAYLERNGAPAHPTDLASRACIVHDTGPDSAVWQFSGPDGPFKVAVSGALAPTMLRPCAARPWQDTGSPCCRKL